MASIALLSLLTPRNEALELLKAALNGVVAEEQLLDDPEDLTRWYEPAVTLLKHYGHLGTYIVRAVRPC